MAQVAANADEYAVQRQNIFFKTIYPSLEGQCVTLVKCFMEDMSEVPNPHAARGDAKLVGKTLVAQGHAVEVPFSKRKRGDLICYEYGEYGHIAVQLSGGRVFEQNVNLGGVQSKIVDGQRVYASRIGSENEAWRVGKNPHVYRLKTYKEGDSNMIDENDIYSLRVIMSEVEGQNSDDIHSGSRDKEIMAYWKGKTWEEAIQHSWVVQPTHRGHLVNSLNKANEQLTAKNAEIVALNKRIKELEAGGQFVETKVYVKKEG